MIKTLKLKNFTAFSDLEIEFSPKINIIIGENSTGKTHLLKAAYALCNPLETDNNLSNDSEDQYIKTFLRLLFLRLFLPLDGKLGKLHRTSFSEEALLEATFKSGNNLILNFNKNSKFLVVSKDSKYQKHSYKPIFIPTKEVLSFMKGFTSLYEKYDLAFDQTYQDICLLLDLPEVRTEKLPEKSKWAMDEIEEICGGKFIFYGGGKVIFKKDKEEYSANTMAEGFRKAGMLSRLLETGAIQPGISGPLFWDEPESNMNPKLMRLLVEILLELSRNGQQIILATHDYIALKWFDLLMDKGKEDHVLFHALYKDPKTKEIKIESVDDYNQIDPNAIANTFSDLTDEEISKSMGELGK